MQGAEAGEGTTTSVQAQPQIISPLTTPHPPAFLITLGGYPTPLGKLKGTPWGGR